MTKWLADRIVAVMVVLALGTTYADKTVQLIEPPAVKLPAFITSTPVSAGTAQVVPGDQLFIIDSKVECLVLSSPPGHVKVSTDPGPIRIKGRFVGGDGKVETRNFPGPFIYTLEAEKTGRCELIVVPLGVKDEKEVIRRLLDVALEPIPPPIPPKPPEPPTPPQPPTPIPVDGLHVLIKYESEQKKNLSAGQLAIVNGTAEVANYLNSVCATEADGKNKAWRSFDQNATVINERPYWAKAMARPHSSVPWYFINNGTTYAEGPIPPGMTVEEFKTLVGKFVKGK